MDMNDVKHSAGVLPSQAQLDSALQSLHHELPDDGLGDDLAQQHMTRDIVPALNQSSLSSRYYGFVTGGATPVAAFADNLVTRYDQNVQVHLPGETIATDVESAALDLICDLLELDPKAWEHRTFTTGATASNIVGLACAREYVVTTAASHLGKQIDVSSLGLFVGMREAGIDDVQILTSAPHSSLRKAASIVGLGHASVKDIGISGQPYRIDLDVLESMLQIPRTASIIAISCAEVNSGLFATNGEEMIKVRELADRHGAWIHIDAAFGLLARVLPSSDARYADLKAGVEGMEIADSIAGDAHKLFNVPYDCGIFLSRHLSNAISVFQNPGAPYLSTSAGSIPSPLNIGIENSRRFRALPVYANLVAYGRKGFREMLQRQIELARTIAAWIQASEGYRLLSLDMNASPEERLRSIFMIVLFRHKDEGLNATLVKKINSTRQIYVSGTKWGGKDAARFAVSNWQADAERDWEVIRDVLINVTSDDG
jgi:glutamate/tyrosine decarboxylase-like PLP-dependent enzyme